MGKPELKTVRSIRPTNDKDSFIVQASKIHDSKYDYSLVNGIKNRDSVVTIICPIHGKFNQTVERHLKGNDCRKCGWVKTRLTMDEFIKRSKEHHGDKFDYSKVSFTGTGDKILIVCPTHGEFRQEVRGHIKGHGCEKCARDALTLDNKEFIYRATDIHGDKYDYSNVKYTTNYDKVDIRCRKHGIFSQRPYDHYRGSGCPKCKTSHGERLIELFLSKNNIDYIREYSILGTPYRYDFYIPELNLLVEYDGQLHFNRNNSYGGEKLLKHVQKLDKIKDALACEQGYFLLRIDYRKYRFIQTMIVESINCRYPYRYNNKFYTDVKHLMEDNNIESNAIGSILDKYKTCLVLQEVKFAVKLKHNIKNYKKKPA